MDPAQTDIYDITIDDGHVLLVDLLAVAFEGRGFRLSTIPAWLERLQKSRLVLEQMLSWI